MFAPLEVPERDSPIIAATGEPAAIGAHLECMHRALMGFSHLYALPAVNIPPAQHSVTASTAELLPTWTPGHSRGQPPPVWTPGHATYPGRQLMPDPPVGTRRHLPHVHALQIGSASQLLPVRTPGHCEEDGVGVVGVLVPLYAGTRGRIPQPDGIIPPATG